MERGRRYGDDPDHLMATELRLGLPGADEKPGRGARGSKRATPEVAEEPNPRVVEPSELADKGQESAPVAKAQVVGWPPIRSYRKNSFQARKSEAAAAATGAGIYVKVSMDGAPYLRKIDLKVYKSYEELREALEDMFKCFSLGDVPTANACGGTNYAVAYEDKDGDWMLVGDVPWRMFISSCKRLRIMKGSEARGLSSNS